MTLPLAAEIVAFWRSAGATRWFNPDHEFDAEIRQRFIAAHKQAADGELQRWERSVEGTYALLLLLDQFPRNMFRGTKRALATDRLALGIAERAIERGLDQALDNPDRQFFYMPLMHAEDLAIQERCVALTRASGDEESLKYAIIHRDIIRDFGRFPHRNFLLGRETTPEEQAYLDSGGFKG